MAAKGEGDLVSDDGVKTPIDALRKEIESLSDTSFLERADAVFFENEMDVVSGEFFLELMERVEKRGELLLRLRSEFALASRYSLLLQGEDETVILEKDLKTMRQLAVDGKVE